MSNDRDRRFGGAARGVLVSSALFAGVLVSGPPAGAAGDDPVPASNDLTIAETSAVAPLTPGVRSQRHFEARDWLPYGDDFARVENSGDSTVVIELIDRAGAVTTETLGLTSVAGDLRGLAINDGAVLVRSVDPIASASTGAGVIVRQTGAVINLGRYPNEVDAPAMSDDASVIVSNALGVPFWLDISDGLVSRTFAEDDNGDIAYTSGRPSVDHDGTVAVIVATQFPGGPEAQDVLVVDPIEGGASDQLIELACPAVACEHEIGGVHVDGFFVNVYVGTFALEAGPGSSRVSATYSRISSNTVASVPVAAISPNGRFLVGNSQVGDAPEPTKTKVVVYDTETDRRRVVSIQGLVNGHTVVPLSVSDDGLFVQYETVDTCVGLCLITPTYMGWFELEPTAPVTNGPAADQIQRLYRAVFGRIPDAGGFEFWMNRYRNGESLFDIAAAFAGSPEFVERFGAAPTDAELIDALYDNVLGRAGDAGGVAFWLDRRAGGTTIPQLLVAFAESPENIERTGTRAPITIAEGRIIRLYRAVFGRAPDVAGLAFWLGEYTQGQTLEQIAARFMISPEFTTRYGDMPSGLSLVDALYRNVLGRRGDDGGIEFWTGRLQSGTTVAELLVAFANSDENIVNTGTVR